jgi:hypothetical protein
MPYAGYQQDLSQLIEDCLLPINDVDTALIDHSIQTLQAMLFFDIYRHLGGDDAAQ